jgi:hypothetical protein
MKRPLGKIAAAFLVLVLAAGMAAWAQAQTCDYRKLYPRDLTHVLT